MSTALPENAQEATRLLAQGQPALVWRRLVADTETPVGAALKLMQPGRGDFLLESVEGGEVRGRYSLLGLDPDLVFRARGASCEVNRNWQSAQDAFTPLPGDSLGELRALAASCRIEVPGELPRESDWWDHLSTAFPEVRLKSFLEMRGADGGPWNRICALPAFWVGLLYDQTALDAAWDLVKAWDMEGRENLRNEVPRLALDAPLPGGGKLSDIAGEVLAIARSGLAARARLNAAGDNETGFLNPLDEIVKDGRVPAQRLLDLYHGEWGEDVSRVYATKSF